MATKNQLNFRKAQKDDIKIVKEMIQELADFEKMSDGPKLTEQDLIRDSGLDGGQEYCHIYVLDLIEADQTTIVGYASCSFSYASWLGRTYFLEEIYVRPAYRGIGAESLLFTEVAAKANEFGCKCLDFHILSWNPVSEFYKNLGAKNMTEGKEYHFYRLQERQIEQLAQHLHK